MIQSLATRFIAPFVLAVGLLVSATECIAQDRPLGEAESSTIGYDSVADAMTHLRSKPGVEFSTENGWTIAVDRAALTVWSFAPEQYPAYPAVVMRRVVEREEQVSIEMNVLCEASKADCDELVRTFAAMNGLRVE
jgi:hypothetical protein